MTTFRKGKILRFGIGFADPFAYRKLWTPGSVKPDKTSVGVIMEAGARTVQATALTVPAGAITYTNYDFYGKVSVTDSGAKIFRNCRFFGDATGGSSGYGLLHLVNSNVASVLVEDCDFNPQTPSLWANGIQGHHYTVRRSRFMNLVDGCDVFNTAAPTAATGVTIEMNWFGDHSWWYDGGVLTQADGTHNDGVQLMGGSGTIIQGNFFWGYNTKLLGTSPYTWKTTANGFSPDDTATPHSLSNLMITPNVGAVTSIQFLKNWCYGGQIGVNAGDDTNAGNFLGTFNDNIFGHDQYFQGPGGNGTYTISFDTNSTHSQSNNLYDNGAAITVRSNQ